MAETTRRKEQHSVLHRPTQRAASAHAMWSIEEDGLRCRLFPYGAERNSVVDFRFHNNTKGTFRLARCESLE